MANAKALVLHDDARTVAMVRAIVAAEGFDVAAADSPYRLLEVAPDAAPDLLLLGLAGLDERMQLDILADIPGLSDEIVSAAGDYGREIAEDRGRDAGN